MLKKRIYTKRLGTLVAKSAKPKISRKYHVISGDDSQWVVVADGNRNATRKFNTQFDAVKFARQTAIKINGEVVVHKKSGEIEERMSLAK